MSGACTRVDGTGDLQANTIYGSDGVNLLNGGDNDTIYAAVVRDRKPNTRPFTYHLPGGDRVGLMTFFPELDEQGEVAQIGGMMMDATELYTARNELQEARIKSVPRRTMAPVHAHGRPSARIRIGRCVVDTDQKCQFDAAGEKIALTAMEYDLLYTFVSHPKRVLTCDQLLEMAHHQRWDPFDRPVDIRITRLRKKIEIDPAKPTVLRTVRGEGYMLVPDGE